jgi:hypothetical protein
MLARIVAAACGCALAFTAAVPAAKADPDDRAPVRLIVGGDVIPWRLMSVFVLPGETIDIRIDEKRPIHEYTLGSAVGTLRKVAARRWKWQAPKQPGLVKLELKAVRGHDDDEDMEVRVWVMVPRSRAASGVLNGYRIGTYPSKPLRGSSIHAPPPGFVEVTRSNVDNHVSPNFRLNQFLVKQQQSEWPKYVVLQTKLLIKLEEVLARVQRAGHDVDTLFVMSGYRTPWYNRSIGNETTYSQHLWGGAADVFVDDDGDGAMDDLNGDTRVDRDDAEVLEGIVVDVERMSRDLAGGLSTYGGTGSHGPFVHLDVRGVPARW